MTILEIIPSFYPVGGAETFVASLSESLAKDQNNKVICLSLYPENDLDCLSQRLKNRGVQVIHLNKHKGVDLKCALELSKAIKRLNPDIIHSHLKGSILSLYMARAGKNVPWIYTFHTTVSEQMYGSKNSFSNFLLRRLIRSKRLIPVGISNNVSKSVESFFKCQKVATIKNGVNVERFSIPEHSTDRKIDFLFVGRFIPLKHPLEIIKAFEKANTNFDHRLNLTMAGDGILRKDCLDYIKSKDIKNITLTGFTNSPEKLFKQAKFFIMASSIEGNPIVVNEALASGCYVVATNVGGISEVTSSVNSRLIDYNDITLVNDLSLTICEIYKNRAFLLESCLAAAPNTRESVSIDRSAKEYSNEFGKILHPDITN